MTADQIKPPACHWCDISGEGYIPMGAVEGTEGVYRCPNCGSEVLPGDKAFLTGGIGSLSGFDRQAKDWLGKPALGPHAPSPPPPGLCGANKRKSRSSKTKRKKGRKPLRRKGWEVL